MPAHAFCMHVRAYILLRYLLIIVVPIWFSCLGLPNIFYPVHLVLLFFGLIDTWLQHAFLDAIAELFRRLQPNDHSSLYLSSLFFLSSSNYFIQYSFLEECELQHLFLIDEMILIVHIYFNVNYCHYYNG